MSATSLTMAQQEFSILYLQKSVPDLGSLKCLQCSWPCQKQPFTNIAVLNFDRTISGRPGKSLRCNRNLKPAL